jgi:uncharacterized alkaline shock family protein YloU
MDEKNSLGHIFISHKAIATIAYQTALHSYGVVGLTARNLADSLAQVLIKDPTLGVDVHFDEESLHLDMYIIVEYGVNIKSVAMSVSESIKFQAEKTTGLRVSEVNIHVRGLRISNTD